MDFHIPFTKSSPVRLLKKVDSLNIQLKEYGLPRVIMESNGDKFYTYDTGIYAIGQLDCTTVKGQADAYNACSPLNAVVNRWLRAASNARWIIVDADDQPIKSVKSSLPDLMLKPNALQSWNEFILQSEAMIRVHGQCFWYKLRPDGMKDVRGLWVIPNYMILETLSGKFLKQSELSEIVTGYEIIINGISMPVSPDEIIKVRDSSVNFYAGMSNANQQGRNVTDGQSRIYAMSDVINGLIAAYQAKKNTIVKRGPMGILGADKGTGTVMNVPMTPKDEKALHEKLEQAYGNLDGQRQEVITKEALKWTQITKGIKDLMLFEEIESGTREICATMDYPFELLGYGSGASLAGGGKYLELKKMLYSDSIIPDTTALGIAITKNFLPPNTFLKPFFDHMDFYQRSRLDDATALKMYNEACLIAVQANAMTTEQWVSGLENYL